MNFKAAIFDLDGTLFDSMKMWKNLASDYVKSLGKDAEPQLDSVLASLTLQQAIEYCIKKYGIDGTAEEHAKCVNEMVAAFYFTKVELKNGVKEFLERLSASGVKMCIATATDIKLVEPAVKRNGIFDYFSEIYTCSGVGANKQTAKIYDTALEHLGTAKEETLVFEDAYYAALTAKQAGYRVVGIYDENEPKTAQVEKLCDTYVRRLDELTDDIIASL
ncbi:MAG: HAD family phosphatase [Clostridia bacterium]|nr:HAD family phosphatase [Clostridia bacterium]